MVLQHVAHGARAVVVGAAPFHAERLGDDDLHVVDVAAVPDGLEEAVGEAQEEQVLHRLLAEVVVDAEDLGLVEDRRAGSRSSARAESRSRPNGFSIDDAGPWPALGGPHQPGRPQAGGDRAEGLRRRGEVEEDVAAACRGGRRSPRAWRRTRSISRPRLKGRDGSTWPAAAAPGSPDRSAGCRTRAPPPPGARAWPRPTAASSREQGSRSARRESRARQVVDATAGACGAPGRRCRRRRRARTGGPDRRRRNRTRGRSCAVRPRAAQRVRSDSTRSAFQDSHATSVSASAIRIQT